MKDTKKKITIKNIFWYLQGTTRYRIMSSWFKNIFPWYLRDQIEHRVNSMHTICRTQGSCKECGCMTPALAYCDEECLGRCYPRMLNKKEYKNIITGGLFCDIETALIWIIKDGKFKPINLPRRHSGET